MQVFKMIIEIPKVVEISPSIWLYIMHHSEFSSEKTEGLSWFKDVSYFVSAAEVLFRVWSSCNFSNPTELFGFTSVCFMFHFSEENWLLSHEWFSYEWFRWGLNLFHFLSRTAHSSFCSGDRSYHCFFFSTPSPICPQVWNPELAPKLLFRYLTLGV